jgi:hypothetical protein
MIPAFDPATGNLPPGLHVARWDEIERRFGYTDQRRMMLAGLALAIEHLRQAGCRRVFLDGSFVSNAPAPRDYDACWDVAGVDLPRLGLSAPALFDLEPGRKRQKAVYQGELFPTTMPTRVAGLPVETILDLFQTDKITNQPKGIIVLELGSDR